MDLDDESNGMFLRERYAGESSAMSRHQGYHKQYTNVISDYLDEMDINKSVSELEEEVFNLQHAARKMMEEGTPIYKKDHIPSLSGKYGKIGRTSERIYGVAGGKRTEELIRRKIEKYGI